MQTLPVRFYDSSNILLDNITSSDGEAFTASVRAVIRAYKEVEIVPSIEMLDEGYTWSYVLSRSRVILYGDRSVLNGITSVQTATITATPGMHNTPVATDVILPEDVDTASGFSKTITVTITVTELTDTAEFSVPITYSRKDGDLVISDDSTQTVKVTITGPRSAVKAFNTDRITATVDLYGMAEGTHKLPIRVTVDGKTNDGLTVTQEAETATVKLLKIVEE